MPNWRLFEGVYTIGLCILRFPSGQICSTERRNMGITSRRQILQEHVAPHKKSGKKGCPSRRVIQKCEPHERNPCAPEFAERTQDEALHQEHQARGVAWDLGNNVCKLNNTDKATFDSPVQATATPEHQCTC